MEQSRLRSDIAFVSLLGLSFFPAVYLATLRNRKGSNANACARLTRLLRTSLLLLGLFTGFVGLHLIYLHRLTFPSGLTFPVVSQRVGLAQQTDSGWYLFNPSVVRYNGQIVVAVREGNLNNCPEFTSWLDFRRFLHVDSHVHLASVPSIGAMVRPMPVSSTLTNNGAGVFYHGVDDPRVVVGADGKLYATVVQNNRLFISSFAPDLSETSRLKVEPQWPGAYPKQKNWMHLPATADARADRMMFVQWLNPLAIAELDPATGKAWLSFSSNTTLPMPTALRGSTNFLQHPTKPGRFFALAHEKEELYPPIIISFFRSRVVEIEKRENGEWAVTGLSDQFSVPSGDEKDYVHRIHYPTSLMYESESDKSSLIIGMGFMDCSAHIVRAKTSDVVAMVQPIRQR